MGYYHDCQRVNVFLGDKFKELALGKISKLDVNVLVLNLTTDYPVSEKYIQRRIALLLTQFNTIELKKGVLVRHE